MATENPRLAAYPPRRVYERLIEFKRERGFKSDSAAVVAALEAYFFGEPPIGTVGEPPALGKRLEDLEGK